MKRFVLGLVGLTYLIGVGAFLGRHIAVTLTDSLTHRVFWLTGAGKAGRGDYVVFELKLDPRYFREEMEKLGGDRVRVIKRVVCVPGDRLEVDGKRFYCNNRLIAVAVDRSSKGVSVRVFSYNGTVPEGKLFVLGSSPKSYDSRYFGFVDVKEVKSVAKPLI